MSLKEKIKSVPALHRLGRTVKYAIPEFWAGLDLLWQRRLRREGPIKVGFLCQYLPAWEKLIPIYRRMQADPRFEPVIIAIPSGIADNRLVHPESLENDTYDHLISHGYPEALNALVGKEQWLDLQKMELSYVFCLRPYNDMMPAPYTSGALSKHTRVCLILYGMPFGKESDSEVSFNRGFITHCYLYFAENQAAMDRRMTQGKIRHKLGLQRTVRVGMPVAEVITESKGEESPAWEFATGDFRVMWTPRWTSDKIMGGTNFFALKDAILDYARQNPKTDILLRPHPLMFDNFVKTGELTREEAECYKAQVAELPNTAFDPVKNYNATFWGTDVLVSDLSGMMPEFLFTGKPLIFCRNNMEMPLMESVEQLFSACYTVYTKEELFQCLDRLRAGDDPLADKRRQELQRMFGEDPYGAAQKIMDVLIEDARYEA